MKRSKKNMPKKTAGTIAAGHEETAHAGKLMLQRGGNAFDAALAAMLASCVAEPSTTSAGGGGFLLAHTPSKNILFDFFRKRPFPTNAVRKTHTLRALKLILAAPRKFFILVWHRRRCPVLSPAYTTFINDWAACPCTLLPNLP